MRGDEVDTANRFHDWRGVQWHHDDDGTLVLNARLTPEQGALVRQALKAAVEAVDNASAETSSTGRDSRGQRQADALAAMAEAYLVTGVQPGSGGDRHLVEDERGTPLDVGRKTRSIPPAIRRALQVRDRGCRFPGCTNRRFVDGHHIRHWAAGGETSLANLTLLCRRHHRAVHEGGYSVEATCDPHHPCASAVPAPTVTADHRRCALV
ncbi:MAG: HNH endonuclease [Actinomycetota bacterium]|nr:HNH endonuclease [Actinomycetota bacterium]